MSMMTNNEHQLYKQDSPSFSHPVKRKALEEESEPKPKKKQVTGKVEVIFSFDTTGSMYACLSENRRSIKEAIQRLKAEVPGIRISIIAHGDYCDAH